MRDTVAEVNFVGATCLYPGNPVPAVESLELEVKDGEFMVLVGPSGSGKSTALRMVAGLEEVTTGQILIDGADVSHRPSKDRDIAMVFQSYALYPHMSVAENMAFGLKLKGMPKVARREKVREAAQLLDLESYLQRKPKALSGGQRQRVAMGRAIVREPSVFLMDEPLSNLDAKLRVETRANIAALQARLGTTTIYVTHDQVEAMTMGDRVAVLKDGVLQQVDTPRNLYDQPANAFVAGFMGSPSMNLRTVPVADGTANLGGLEIRLPNRVKAALKGAPLVTVGIRPEAFLLAAADEPGLSVSVRLVEEFGADAYVYGSVPGDEASEKPLVIRFQGRSLPRLGDVVRVGAQVEQVHFFDAQSGSRIV
jgi:multiple sugar transport system ATP-binding protein